MIKAMVAPNVRHDGGRDTLVPVCRCRFVFLVRACVNASTVPGCASVLGALVIQTLITPCAHQSDGWHLELTNTFVDAPPPCALLASRLSKYRNLFQAAVVSKHSIGGSVVHECRPGDGDAFVATGGSQTTSPLF